MQKKRDDAKMGGVVNFSYIDLHTWDPEGPLDAGCYTRYEYFFLTDLLRMIFVEMSFLIIIIVSQRRRNNWISKCVWTFDPKQFESVG